MEQSTRNLNGVALAPVMAPAAQGSALYVINLCASMAPIGHDKPVPGFEAFRVYQVSRKEDGRIRYRLRIGFFADEAEAETALALIREHYPTAFATSLCDEDQRHTRGHTSSAPAPQPLASLTAVTNPTATPLKTTTVTREPNAPNEMRPSAPAVVSRTAAPKALQLAPAKAEPAQTAKAAAASDTQRVPALKMDAPKQATANAPAVRPSKPTGLTDTPPAHAQQRVELTLAAEPAITTRSAPAKVDSNEPFHVGKGVDIPASVLTLSLEPTPVAQTPAELPKAPAAKAAPPVAPQSRTAPANLAMPKGVGSQPVTAPVSKTPAVPKGAPPKATPAPPPKHPSVLNLDAPLPDLDSTQTIRALTAAELDDESQPKWFAVQLAVSEQPINLDTMPQLDIFAAYYLYSVATAGGGKIQHHMRIGFFKEQVSAEAVSGYLKTFFASPTVLRVSVAEYTRFSEGPKRIAPAEPKAKVIDIAAARDRSPAKEIPVVTQEVVNPATTGRFPKPTIESTGVHKRPPMPPPKAAPKTATATKSVARPKNSTSTSGKHRTLQQALLDEAREVELSESAIRRLPKSNSLLSKLFGKK